MKYLGIDLGSSFTKGAVLDTGAWAVTNRRKMPAPSPAACLPGRYEVDAEAYFAQVENLVRGMLDETPEIQGILFSTQMHGFVITDADFSPVTPYISWQDRASMERDSHGETYLQRLAERLGPDAMDHTGVPLKQNLSMCNLFSRVQQGQLAVDGKRFNSLGGYMLGRLGAAHVCHSTNAAPTGMLDVLRQDWNVSLIDHAELAGMRFPSVLTGVEACGTYLYRGKQYALYPDIGDHQACVLANHTRPGSDINVNIGTAGLIGRVDVEFSQGDYETRPYFDGMYLRSISGMPGGRHLDVLAGFLGKCMEEMAGAADMDAVWRFMTNCDGESHLRVELTGCFGGEGGRIEGIDSAWTPRELVCGAYAGMGEAYRQAMNRLGGAAERIVFSGGCAQRNAALRGRVAGAMGMPYEASGQGDAMEGLMLLAMVAEGRTVSVDQARRLAERRKEGENAR